MRTQNVSRPTRLVSRGRSWPVAYVDSQSAAFGEYGVLPARARRTRQFHSTGPVPLTPPTLVRQTQLLQAASMQGPLRPPDLLVRIIILCYNYLQLIDPMSNAFCFYEQLYMQLQVVSVVSSWPIRTCGLKRTSSLATRLPELLSRLSRPRIYQRTRLQCTLPPMIATHTVTSSHFLRIS